MSETYLKAIRMTELDNNATFTVIDYLINKVRFGMPRKALVAILADRCLSEDERFSMCDRDTIRLAYADMLKWFVLGPSKVNNTSDSDNGWAHTEGGYELSSSDRSEMKAEANAIYKELEPESVMKRKTTFRINSHGVKHANYTLWNKPLAHVIKK